MKLPIGKRNVLLTICPIGYAEGSNRPKAERKPQPQTSVKVILRKAEYGAA